MLGPRPIPLISVLMPAYNAAPFLPQAIESILSQSCRDFEFIIIDDGSTDETAEVLSRYTSDPRVSGYSQRHMGVTPTRIESLKLARGKYIAGQDADDVSLPFRLERQVEFLESHPDHAFVGSNFAWIDVQGNILHETNLPSSDELIRSLVLDADCFMSPTFLQRRDAVEHVGGYRREFPLGEDTDLELRLMERYNAANIPEVLYYYRSTGSNISTRMSVLKESYIRIARELALQRQETGIDVFMTEARPLSE